MAQNNPAFLRQCQRQGGLLKRNLERLGYRAGRTAEKKLKIVRLLCSPLSFHGVKRARCGRASSPVLRMSFWSIWLMSKPRGEWGGLLKRILKLFRLSCNPLSFHGEKRARGGRTTEKKLKTVRLSRSPLSFHGGETSKGRAGKLICPVNVLLVNLANDELEMGGVDC